MRSWKTWTMIAVAGLVLGAVGCGPSREDVEDEIAAADHCDTPADCTNVGSYCPFGCYVLVHTSEATRIRGEIEDYYDAHPGEQCMVDCMPFTGVDCVSGRCEALLAD